MRVKAGSVYQMYSTVRPNIIDVQRAELKAKFRTGTYTLQENRSAFNKFKMDPICKLYKQDHEPR